jgi:hypothetical protein
MTTHDAVKILYIGGTGRTGSTLLEKLLGQDEGWFAAGELTFLWRFLDTGRCSCGLALRDCAVWTEIFDAAYGGFDAAGAADLVALRRRFRSVHLPLMASGALRRRYLARLDEFPQRVERLYHGIAAVTGSRVVVDSSKEPHYSWILGTRPALDVHFLHLVRDPRAVAHSWRRRVPQLGLASSEEMERRSLPVAATYFDVSNLAAEALWRRRPGRYLRVRYEDFVTDPTGVLGQIEAFVGEPVHVRHRIDGGVVHLESTHSAWGNPNRFGEGTVALRPDVEWAQHMGTGAKALVTAMTIPFVGRYGYSWWPRRADPEAVGTRGVA